MAIQKTSLSAGAIIRDLLLSNEEVKKRTRKVFPIVTDEATLPYILYRRAAFDQTPTKAGSPAANAVTMEIFCFTQDYAGSVDLAEAVRAALDYATAEKGDLCMRSCVLVDAEEMFEDDAFVQRLIFHVKV